MPETVTQTIKRTFGPCGKYGSRLSNGTTLGRYIHRRQLKRGILRPYWNTTLFKGLRELYEQTLYELDLLFEYKKKDLPCADIIAFFTSFIDVQDIA
jgi:hypothetical protein